MRLAALAFVSAAVAVSSAQVVIKPSGEEGIPMVPKTLDVSAKVAGGVSEETWDYVFATRSDLRGEADFVVAIPEGGVVTGFAYWYQGEKVVAKVVEKERAREIYRIITAPQSDPALVELVGKKTFRAKIFPIEAGADLRVEVKMARTLTAHQNGWALDLPLRAAGKPERLSVTVDAPGKIVSPQGSATDRFVRKIEGGGSADLRLVFPRAGANVRHEFRSARSGGAEAFWSLILHPSRALRNVRVAGLVDRRLGNLKAGATMRLVGRAKPGATSVTILADGFRQSIPLTVSNESQPNDATAKLWAWERIHTSKNRSEVVALSVRHGVPSAHTSWLAIPIEERAEFARQIAASRLARSLNDLARIAKKYGPTSARTLRAIESVKKSGHILGVSPTEANSPKLDAYVYVLDLRYSRLLERGRGNTAEGRRLKLALARFNEVSGRWTNFRQNEINVLGAALRDLPARIARGESVTRTPFIRYARAVGQPVDEVIGQWLDKSKNNLALAAARGRETGERDETSEVALRRIARFARIDPEKEVRGMVVGFRRDQLFTFDRLIAPAYADPKREIDSPLAARKALIARTPELRQDVGPELQQAWSEGKWQLEANVIQGDDPVSALASTWDRRTRFTERLGIGDVGRGMRSDDALRLAENLRHNLDSLEREARRDRRRLAAVRKNFDDVRALVPAGTRLVPRPAADARDRYVFARHAGDDATARQEGSRVSQDGSDWSRHRLRRLESLTELDRLDALGGATATRTAELEQIAEEMRVRMGDPYVESSRSEERLPDGSSLKLHPIGEGRFAARFEVPEGSPEGPYRVADGRFAVDTTAPTFTTQRIDDTLRVLASADARRAVVITDTERIEMTPLGNGRFEAPHPSGDYRIVVTDKAHNRSDTVAVSGPAEAPGGEPVAWMGRIRGELWVSTLNAGATHGGRPVTGTGPWPRQVAELGGKPVVRLTDGTLVGDVPKPPRTTTCLVRDGDRLLAGVRGGWMVLVNGVWSVHLPTALKGIDVTALRPDGDRLLIGTQGRGLAIATGADEISFVDERYGLGDDWVTALGTDADGTPLVGTFVGGAYRLVGGKAEAVTETAGRCVTAINRGWIATRAGLFRNGRLVKDGVFTAVVVEGETAIAATKHGFVAATEKDGTGRS